MLLLLLPLVSFGSSTEWPVLGLLLLPLLALAVLAAGDAVLLVAPIATGLPTVLPVVLPAATVLPGVLLAATVLPDVLPVATLLPTGTA